MRFDQAQLETALTTVPERAWSTPATYAETNVLHDVHDAWLSRIQPGGYIADHTDASRWRERWHIPIRSAGVTVLNGIEHLPIQGHPLRVRHWQPHSVWMLAANRDRIHLIIDTTQYAGPDQPAPFRLC